MNSPGPDPVHVRDIMSRDVVSVGPNTSVSEVARRMVSHGISGLPVCDEAGRLVGVITDHDLIIRNTPIEPPAFVPFLEGRIPLESARHFERRLRHIVGSEAGDVMSVDVVSIPSDAEIEALAALMIHRRLHFVPVTEGEKLAGVVTRADIIRWMIRGTSEIS